MSTSFGSYKELRVSLDGEAFHPQGHHSLEVGDEFLVLYDVVGDLFAPLEAECTA